MSGITLVTGATGYIGQEVLNLLMNKNIRLRIVVRKKSTNKLHLNEKIISIVETDDLFSESEEWWAKTFLGVDKCLHLAWFAKPGEYLDSKMNLHCMNGTLKMAKGFIAAGGKYFAGVGTCLEYDESSFPLRVSSPIRPKSIYAISKAKTNESLKALFDQSDVGFSWSRIFYLYGGNEDSRRLYPIVRASLEKKIPLKIRNGDLIRDYMPISEAAKALADILVKNITGPINICSGVPVTIKEFLYKNFGEYEAYQLIEFQTIKTLEPRCVVGVKSSH